MGGDERDVKDVKVESYDIQNCYRAPPDCEERQDRNCCIRYSCRVPERSSHSQDIDGQYRRAPPDVCGVDGHHGLYD